ncbi:hypothetical protein HAHE_24120 [Haloferula helveola]|uniref:Transposase n=1 Tax=Haloferula helveola TaxID=490095 RepID=A0ABM7RAP9_9BACT|nr:hypothetical protein HAHE_24120 [Haloferula helveola]
MSEPSPKTTPRPSASADAALRAELERIERMSIKERIMTALTMRNRFDWLKTGSAERSSPGK